ncbi:MAG: hypothetical protein LBC88_03075 [Spirochaetaceae bacterium]|nr:hypothetical protein [Spirochaetaceae bacterium]
MKHPFPGKVRAGRRRAARPARYKAAGVICAALFFAACATAPRLTETGGDFDLLDGGGRIYFVADVPLARPILDHAGFSGLFGADTAELLDRTRRASVALYDDAPGKPGDDSGAASISRRFHLAARGSYPASRAGIGLGLSAAWRQEKSRAGGTYWRSGAGLGLYLTARTALVSDADPLFRAAAPERPPALEDLVPGAAVAGWIRDPAAYFDGLMRALGIPVHVPAETLVFALYPVEDAAGNSEGESARYHAVIRLETPAPAQARALTFILNTARSYAAGLPRSGDRIIAFALAVISSPPELDGNALVLRIPPLDAETIALLFRLFSL